MIILMIISFNFNINMEKNSIKCIRCNGKGNVRKYIMEGCSEYLLGIWDVFASNLLYFSVYLCTSVILGGILGFFYFILLKNALSFNIFRIIFYFFGGMSMTFMILTLLSNDKIIFKHKVITIIVFLFLIFFGYMNIKFGHYLFYKKGFFITLINLIYAFIQGGSIGFILIFLLFKKDMLDEVNGRTKCPLCEGSKYISNKLFNEVKRCQYCLTNCGYENPKGIPFFQKRYFCKKCKGIGFIKKFE